MAKQRSQERNEEAEEGQEDSLPRAVVVGRRGARLG
jgi:hypothetical protein